MVPVKVYNNFVERDIFKFSKSKNIFFQPIIIYSTFTWKKFITHSFIGNIMYYYNINIINAIIYVVLNKDQGKNMKNI